MNLISSVVDNQFYIREKLFKDKIKIKKKIIDKETN